MIAAAAMDRWDLATKSQHRKPPPRLVLIGEPGVGKTTFGTAAPGAILIPTEDGALGSSVARLPREGKCDTWDDLLKALTTLAIAEHDYRWAVLDTANAAEHLAAEHVCKRDFGGQWHTIKGQEGYTSFGKGDKATAMELRSALILLDDLQQRRNVGVILLCHVGLHKQANALGSDFCKFGGDMNKHSWSLICSWADQVGFAHREMRVTTREGEQRAKASGGGERKITFEGGPGLDAKARLGYEMPESIQLSWEAYAMHLDTCRDPLVAEILAAIKVASTDTKEKLEKRLCGPASAATLASCTISKLRTIQTWLVSQQQPQQ